MAQADRQRDAGASSPGRPSSAWTNSSIFADSAISLRTQTPEFSDKHMNPLQDYELHNESGVADRLNGLVSEIWACEQDGTIRADKRRKIERAMDEIEAALEDDTLSSQESEVETPHPTRASSSPAAPTVTDRDLELVRNSLAATVESMRMRQQEQRHLHQLTIEKLEAVAQRCIQQEKRLHEFAEEMVALKDRNRALIQETEQMNTQLDQTRAEAARKEIAVNAMSSAVAGLEGWINNSPTPHRTPRRIVTRGRGRFRGRYYADEADEPPVSHGSDGGSDGKTLHEGVTAWLRGFRDVEEELRSAAHFQGPRLKEPQNAPESIDDEWGDFESASGV